MMHKINIDIFSDPVCPWCLVGLQRLDNALEELQDRIEATFTYHPFLLDADAPVEGEDVVAMLTRKYGRDPSQMWGHLERAAQESGLTLDMRKQKMRYPSQAAQVLIMAALDKGSQHALARDIGRACYLDALNIADSDVLADIAVRHGFDRAQALEIVQRIDLQEAVEDAALASAQQGVSGVPFFIFNGKLALSGAQPEAVFIQALEQAVADTPS